MVMGVVLLAIPAAAAGQDFPPGEYKGTTGQGRALKFAADPSGVHVFATRVKLSCRDGEKKSVRLWIPHMHLNLDATGGRFTYSRGGPGSDNAVRVAGTIAGTSGTGTLSRRKGACSSGTRPWTAVHSGAAQNGAGPHQHGTDPRFQAGNHAPYPATEQARPVHRRRAEALRRATVAEAGRFATVALADAAGYIADPKITSTAHPGLIHYRKNGPNFWGRVLEPRRPQALIFWCPSTGECVLAAFMYRAPGDDPSPPTYGGLLGWHRHGPRGNWMTHIWLTGSIASSLAQCGPFNALAAHNPLIVYEPYKPDVAGVDEPCPDTAGYVAP